jgi:signal transduction histidine kinase
LAAFITALYISLVAGAGALVGTREEPNVAALSLLATAIIAVAFQPVRERLQRLANRLVFGQRATPYEVLAQFSRRTAAALSIDDVLPRMAEAASYGVGAARSRVRVYIPGGPDNAIAWPADALNLTFDTVVPVQNQGQLVGEIAVAKPGGESLSATELALLTDLAAQAGPALGNVRLAQQLRTQADELRASRQRIVSAQDAERRRIERDLHDGAQQHLVAMAINLRMLEETLRSEPLQAEALLAEVRAEVGEALQTLRDLAHGIYPPALAEHGVVAAVEAHVTRLRPVPELSSDPSTRGRRYSLAVEAVKTFSRAICA